MPEINQPDQRHKLREHFLEMFIRSLIVNAHNPEKDKMLLEGFMAEKLESMADELRKTQAVPVKDLVPKHLEEVSPSETQRLPIAHTRPFSTQNIYQLQKKMGLTEPQMHPAPSQMPLPRYSPIPLPQQTYQPTKFKSGQKIETVNLGKLAGILVDPSVMSVECLGPYKNILINRSGSIQTSAVALTPEEINAIMYNISEQTRIPITPGVFRAAVQDLVVTAVLSDFVGTRFVIYKRNPFQRY